jgi:hypothetical protein
LIAQEKIQAIKEIRANTTFAADLVLRTPQIAK